MPTKLRMVASVGWCVRERAGWGSDRGEPIDGPPAEAKESGVRDEGEAEGLTARRREIYR